MHIKGIKISGFKSYKEETNIKELFNGLNVIVGRNGSGKSNVFSAIEFALTLDTNMKPEVRTSLIYQGRNYPDPAFVEIEFDNSDRKLPVDDSTVFFRRTLATKKDKFFVNGKELVNGKQFLDRAGFTNPYFIVKQGKIQDLALATDAARLKAISAVTGANAYNSKIADCQRAIDAADIKIDSIGSTLQELTERRKSLETEVEEHKRYMKCDQTKRAIEFIMHRKKIEELEHNLKNLESSRNEFNGRQKPIQDELEKVVRDIQINKRQVGESEARMKQLQDSKDDNEASRNRMASEIASYNQELQDIVSRPTNTTSNELLHDEILKYEQLLAKTEHELFQLKECMDELFYRKCQFENRVGQYHEKELIEDRADSAADQRTQEIQKRKEKSARLEECNKSLKLSKTTLITYREYVSNEDKALQNSRENVVSLKSEYNKTMQNMESCKAEEQKCRNLLELTLRTHDETEQKLTQQRDRVARLEDDWKKQIGVAILQGWKGVHKILEDYQNGNVHQDIRDGYHGLVCEIIECDPKLDMAVELAAGKKLVHHVVQTREVAEVILNEFNARKYPGELNFMCINPTTTRFSQLDESQLRGAKLIRNLLSVPQKFSSLAESVFGNTLVCESFERATEMVRQHKVQCVTLDGEKVSKVGVMTGGYRSRRPQKLELQRAKMTDQKVLAALLDKKRVLDQELNQYKDAYQSSKCSYEKYQLAKSKAHEDIRTILSDIQIREKKMQSVKEAIQTLEKNIVDFNVTINVLNDRETLLRSDSNTSDDKIEAIKSFRAVSAEYHQMEMSYFEKLRDKNATNMKLQQLREKYYNFMSSSSLNNENIQQSAIDRISSTVAFLTAQMSDITKKLDDANRELISLQQQTRAKKKKVDDLVETEKKLKDQLMEIINELDSFAAKYSCCFQKLEDENAAGANLAVVPVNLENFEELSDRELCKKLKTLNMKLKNSAKIGVNQKAIQQHKEVQKNCDSIEKKMEHFSEDRANLELFLKDLDTKKGEAMLQNVRLIQEQFQKIFCLIVPQGNAELVLYGNNVSLDHGMDVEDVTLMELAGRDGFEGVKVRVNFLGKRLRDIRSLAQLSGGQKSVVALCLILAIQTIDPVPFYLFDEVDQALDAEYRDAVAKVIGQMSERSQFICTTFRKEFLAVADKNFGVSFDNRCSHIRPINEGQALNFVEADYSSMSASISPSGSFCHGNSAA